MFAIQSGEHFPIKTLVIISIYFFSGLLKSTCFFKKKHHATNVLSKWKALKLISIRISMFEAPGV